jgi:hypothetical protein
MGDLFQVIIYLIIGLIWLISVVSSKNRKKNIPGAPTGEGVKPEPAKTGEKELKDFLRTIGLETGPEPSPEPGVTVEETEEVEEEFPEPPEPVPVRIETPRFQIPVNIAALKQEDGITTESHVPPLPAAYPLLSRLSMDVLEEGIILSALLGPPRSVQLLKGLARGNLRWRMQ